MVTICSATWLVGGDVQPWGGNSIHVLDYFFLYFCFTIKHSVTLNLNRAYTLIYIIAIMNSFFSCYFFWLRNNQLPYNISDLIPTSFQQIIFVLLHSRYNSLMQSKLTHCLHPWTWINCSLGEKLSCQASAHKTLSPRRWHHLRGESACLPSS